MFEKATRLKLRFESKQGLLTVEDLWDLPLQTQKANGASLDQIAVALHRQIKDTAEVSFVTETAKPNDTLQLRFDIVKHVIEVKKAENTAAIAERERKNEKERILEILSRKQDQALENSTEAELRARLATLSTL